MPISEIFVFWKPVGGEAEEIPRLVPHVRGPCEPKRPVHVAVAAGLEFCGRRFVSCEGAGIRHVAREVAGTDQFVIACGFCQQTTTNQGEHEDSIAQYSLTHFVPVRGMIFAGFCVVPTDVTRCFDSRCYVLALATNAKGRKR
jgi:hypothetical protein